MAGELPASFVHQDHLCVAFMDINPMSPGHVLVVPREPVATLTELPPETVSHLMAVAVRVGDAQRKALGSLAQHILINDGKAASQSVPHVHIHVIPRYRNDVVKVTCSMLLHVTTLMLPPYASKSKRARLDFVANKIKNNFY